jgi:hypothetical protein
MARAVYHVLRSTDAWQGTSVWQVERDGVVHAVHRLKTDAICVARWLALRSQPSSVVIERANAAAETESTFGVDCAETLQNVG